MADKGTYSREEMALAPEQFHTRHLTMRVMDTDRDQLAFLKMRTSPDVMQFIGLVHHGDILSARAEYKSKVSKGDFKFFYTIFDKDNLDGDAIGLVIMRPMPEGDTMEVGYWLLPEYWGRGLATEATSSICHVCARAMDFPLADISAHVMVGHDASRRVLEKSGLEVTSISEIDLPKGDKAEVWWFNWANA